MEKVFVATMTIIIDLCAASSTANFDPYGCEQPGGESASRPPGRRNRGFSRWKLFERSLCDQTW